VFGPVVSDDLSFDDIIEKGTVTRVDIAVDVVGIRVDKLDVRFLGDGKSHWYYSNKGQPETGYYGIKQNKKKQNSPAPWVTYNKRQEIKDKGPEGGKQLYGGLSHTRIEFHAIQKKPFAKLGTLANPFDTISLAYPQAPKGIKPYAWTFFLDACHRRGREKALQTISEITTRKKYAAALDEAHKAFWKPEQIWKHWPAAVQQLGLLTDVQLIALDVTGASSTEGNCLQTSRKGGGSFYSRFEMPRKARIVRTLSKDRQTTPHIETIRHDRQSTSANDCTKTERVQLTAHEGRSYRGHHVEMALKRSRHKLEREHREALNEIERIERPKRMGVSD
jgi:hypothetical protein